jgi:hypothetical protein
MDPWLEVEDAADAWANARPPDLICLGGTIRLVALKSLAKELQLSAGALKALLLDLGVKVATIQDRLYASIWALEQGLWRRFVAPELDPGMKHAAEYFAGLDRALLRHRLRDLTTRRKRAGRPPRT